MRWLVLAVMVVGVDANAERTTTGPVTVRGTLLEPSKPGADCGTLEVWTVLHFDVSKDPKAPRGTKVDAKRLPVGIPCTELTRPQYSTMAGNAGVLVKGRTYALTIDGPGPGKWGDKPAWRAITIDDVPKAK